MTDLDSLWQFALLAFSSIFIIVDPFAVAPLFISMTVNDPVDKRNRMAWRASLAALVTLVVFALLGDAILRLFAITLGAFRIAGGIILFGIALNMLRVREAREIQTPEEIQEGAARDDVALIPLAFPLLSGPGAISTVVVLTQQARGRGIEYSIVILIAIFTTCCLSYVTLRNASRVMVVLGQPGLRILTRLMGLLLAVIAVQFILNGVEEAFFNMAQTWLGARPAP